MFFFFFNDTATTEIYTLSLHDALPISLAFRFLHCQVARGQDFLQAHCLRDLPEGNRSEEHTSELQSHSDLVCRLLLEKTKHQGRSPDTERSRSRISSVQLHSLVASL